MCDVNADNQGHGIAGGVSDLLLSVLKADSCDDEEVEKVVPMLVDRVLPLIVDVEKMSEEKLREADESCHHVIHWALHVGQSAYCLLVSCPKPSTPSQGSTDWRMAVKDLHTYTLVMLDTDFLLLPLLACGDPVRDPLYVDQQLLDEWEGEAKFTRARLSLAAGDEIGESQAFDKEHCSPRVFDVLIDHMYRNARLYIHNLDWLVADAGNSRMATSDCMVTLFALALNMTGDALRLEWPL